jgi:hypothetical protein
MRTTAASFSFRKMCRSPLFSTIGISCSSTMRQTAVRTRGCRLFLTQASQTASRCINRRCGRRLAHDRHSRRSRQMQQYLPSHGRRQFKQRSMLLENVCSNAPIERRRHCFIRRHIACWLAALCQTGLSRLKALFADDAVSCPSVGSYKPLSYCASPA